MSVSLSVRKEQLISHWMDIHEVLYLSIFRKLVKKIQVSVTFDNIKVYFTRIPMYSYGNIWLIYYLNEKYEGWNFNSGNSLFTTDTK